MMEKLEMAVSEIELTLERSAKLPITGVSLLHRRKMIKCAYVQATELLDKHRQQAVLVSQGQISQGVKRKRWIMHAKNLPIASSAGFSTDDVGRMEWFARCAGNFLRDVESGCSLQHYTFCNPIVRHLLEGKTLMKPGCATIRSDKMWMKLGAANPDAPAHQHITDHVQPAEQDGQPTIELILFGNIAQELIGAPVDSLIASGAGIDAFLPKRIQHCKVNNLRCVSVYHPYQ
ncbi:hypothetical protein BS78_02G020000 [Paspalum vaginatum]|nr:hypothetical protein BS78_02G020000 [Paspalum vaginatum]